MSLTVRVQCEQIDSGAVPSLPREEGKWVPLEKEVCLMESQGRAKCLTQMSFFSMIYGHN